MPKDAGRSAGRKRVEAICRRLQTRYGPVEPPPQLPVVDELVAVILSQNTSDANSDAAFEELRRRLPTWEAVRQAAPARIARAIRRGGLSRQKAPRIKAILETIHQERGELSLDFLRDGSPQQAMDYLRMFPGVGPKSAACVLLFACRMPVLPVDTHVHRVSRRLGLIDSRVDAAEAHEELARLVPPRLVLAFHIQLIRHGRTLCGARNPKCDDCPLVDLCPEGQKRMGMRPA